MNSFANAVNAPRATVTTNGMAAVTTTGSSIVDLFFNIGAARNNPNIGSMFARAYGEDKNLAARTLFWARDVRGGAGERQTFRNIMLQLEKSDPVTLRKLLAYVPEYGRWDDLLIFQTPAIKETAYNICALGIRSGDGLCAKWMPRKGLQAAELRRVLNMTPKQYRKTLVTMSNTVEQKMCAQEWTEIEFGKLPSIASKQYMKAFLKHTPEQYAAYKAALVKGDAKVNASAIFPHDVIVGMRKGDLIVGKAQWEALPNYLGDGDNFILPMVDVSGSMTCPAGGSNATCLDVAVALGLYLADKQKGKFAGMFLTFSESPQLQVLTGDIAQKMNQMQRSNWGMNTDLNKALKQVLNVAVANSVPQNEMPKYLLILSDMQFDQCTNFSAKDMIESQYKAAGYEMPQIVFWNLNGAYGNQPVSINSKGVALVSGFSPAIMTSILAAKQLSPLDIVLSTINSDRYASITV